MSFDDLAPCCRVVVSGVELNQDAIDAISEIEVDLSRDLADQIKLTIVNPSEDKLGRGYNGRYTSLESKAWLPGNQVDVYLGYGGKPTHIASGIIQKWSPNFPASGMPTLTVTALDASVRMMDGEFVGEARAFPAELGSDVGRIVLDVISNYDLYNGDIQPLLGPFNVPTHKKAGMTDFQFLRGVANLGAFEFKVRYDVNQKKWLVYFRTPTSDQKKKYTFVYGYQLNTLLSFDVSWGLRDQPSEVKVLFLDKFSGIYQEISSKKVSAATHKAIDKEITAKGADFTPDMKYTDAGSLADEKEILSLERIRIATGGISIEVVPERPFESIAMAEAFAARWIKQRRDNFIVGSGTVVGLEELRCGDVHTISGVGLQLSGDYEFTNVTHNFSASGFTTKFVAHKVLGVD